MKKLFILLGLVLFLVGCDTASDVNPVKPNPTEDVKIEILEMNDIHGHIENEGSYGGLARASYLIDEIRAETFEENTVLIGNGDMLQETAIARVSYGQVVIDAMSAMKFDMMGVGNHEFDWGFDTFLNYFDGNKANGEASFPLVNSNIFYKNQLVQVEDKVCSSLLIEKEDVKIGILSYIGNVYSSINANMTLDYSFSAKAEDIAQSVRTLGTELKANGADILVVNIHGGESSSCMDYAPNQILAELKYDGKYLVDAIVNGHTHTRQDALIKRKNGASLPVVQSSGKLADFGRIDLSYNKEKKTVTNATVSHVNISSAKKSDSSIQKIIQEYYDASKDILEEVYCQNLRYIRRGNALYEYISRVMMQGTNATAAVCNTGAFRNNVEIGDFNFDALYALNPFDNHIILCEISGMDLQRFYNANANFEIVYTWEYGASIATDKTYTLAIVDYVYFSNYFAGYRTGEYVDTNLVLRDLIASDLRLRKNTGFDVERDCGNVLLNPVFPA